MTIENSLISSIKGGGSCKTLNAMDGVFTPFVPAIFFSHGLLII